MPPFSLAKYDPLAFGLTAGPANSAFLSDHAEASHRRFDHRFDITPTPLHASVLGLTVMRGLHWQALLFLYMGDPAILHIPSVLLLDAVPDLIVCGHLFPPPRAVTPG